VTAWPNAYIDISKTPRSIFRVETMEIFDVFFGEIDFGQHSGQENLIAGLWDRAMTLRMDFSTRRLFA